MPAPTTSNVLRPQAAGYGCRLDERLFRIAAGPGRELDVQSAPPQAQRLQTSEVPEEFVDEFGQTFARSDFTAGEGLLYAHDRDNPPNASAMFWDSYNIDVSEPTDGSERVLKLLHTTASIEAVSGVVRMAYNGTALYVTDGTGLRRTADPNAATPTWADVDPHDSEGAQDVLDVAVLGSHVYAAIATNGIHRDTGSGWAGWNDLEATRLWGAKNRIVASDGDSIYEVTTSGSAPTALKTIDPDATFNAVVDGGAAILAGASDGYVYAFTPTGTAGALELAAQDLFQGEQIVSLAYAQGLIFVGTSEPVATGGAIGRVWRCDLSGSFTLTNRQLVRQWGSDTATDDHAPHGMLGTRDEVFMTVYSPAHEENQIWRYDLVNAGIARWHILADGGASRSVLLIGGKLFAGIDTVGVYRQTDTYAPSGWLMSSLGDFYSASDKTWVAARLDADVVVGEQVTLRYSTQQDAVLDYQDDGWFNVRVDNGSILADETIMSGVTSRYITGQVVLEAGPSNTTPVVRSFGFRAYPADFDILVEIPINVSDRLERHNRRGVRARGRGNREYQALLEYEGIASTLEVFEIDLVARGQLVRVQAPMAALTERGSQTQFALATFRGRRVEAEDTLEATGTVAGERVGDNLFGGT